MRYLKDCFGCCPLRIGVLIIAALEILVAAYAMYDSVTYIHHVEDEALQVTNSTISKKVYRRNERKLTQSSRITLGVGAAFCVLDILCDTILLIGAIIHKPRFRMLNVIWIMWTFITIALFSIIIIIYIAIAGDPVDIIRVIFTYGSAIILQLFCIWVVYSYFRLLRFMDQGAARYRVMFNNYHGTPQAEFISTTSQEPLQEPFPACSFKEPPSYSDATNDIITKDVIDCQPKPAGTVIQ